MHKVFLITLFFSSCRQSIMVEAPAVYKNSATHKIATKAGVTYCDNKIFSGYLFLLNENKDTVMLSGYLNGKLNGWVRKWYSKNLLMEERFYVNGRKENRHNAWWENGQMKFEYFFKNDEHEGLQKEWFEDGKIYRTMNYSKGHEAGMQTMYRNDGSYIFNYEVKDGRMYGLTGTKNCKNVAESIAHN
jgi:antitoxin component YwqK of YwqJK toxin-antitoxin module